MHDMCLYSCRLQSGKEIFHGSYPSKVLTGVKIDLFAVATGCVELDPIITLFARHVGRYVGCVQ
jgi:hypothetical protein